MIDHKSQSPDPDARASMRKACRADALPVFQDHGGRKAAGEGAKGTPRNQKRGDRPPKQSGYTAEFPHLSGFLPSLLSGIFCVFSSFFVTRYKLACYCFMVSHNMYYVKSFEGKFY